MASFQIKDCYAIMNSLMRQASAQTTLTATDHTSFVDCGQFLLATGTENVLNSIARNIVQVVMQSRIYNTKFNLINATTNQFNTRKAKISFYSSDNDASGAFNTDLNNNIVDGGNMETDGTGSQWEVKLPRVVERFFLSEAAWDRFYTTPLIQLQSAFNDEATFVAFMNGWLTEITNDIAQTIESRNRALVADRIAGVYLLNKNGVLGNETVVNFTTYFNAKCGTNYTTQQILTEHLTELSELVTSKLQIDVDRLAERTTKYHDPMTVTEGGVNYNVLRFTPKSKIKAFWYDELWKDAKTRVMPSIFNTEYINPEKGEKVSFWQASEDASRMKISCKPALPDGAVSENVALDYVLGIIFDEDAMETINQFEGTYTTPIHARKVMQNTFIHYKFGAINDYTENSIIYIMNDDDVTPELEPEPDPDAKTAIKKSSK